MPLTLRLADGRRVEKKAKREMIPENGVRSNLIGGEFLAGTPSSGWRVYSAGRFASGGPLQAVKHGP